MNSQRLRQVRYFHDFERLDWRSDICTAGDLVLYSKEQYTARNNKTAKRGEREWQRSTQVLQAQPGSRWLREMRSKDVDRWYLIAERQGQVWGFDVNPRERWMRVLGFLGRCTGLLTDATSLVMIGKWTWVRDTAGGGDGRRITYNR